MDSRISTILEHWFIGEPALFGVLCTHELVENPRIACPVRSGQRRVEYNPDFVREMSDAALEEALKTEAIRILLKHPYERRPDRCSSEAIALGSNVCIGDQYTYGNFKIEKPSDFSLEGGQPFEWYARRIQELLPPGMDGGEGEGSGGDSDSDSSNGHSNRFDSKGFGKPGEVEDGPSNSGGAGGQAGKSGRKGSGSMRTGNGGGSTGRMSYGDEERLQEARDNAMSNSERNQDLAELWEEDEMAVAMINGVIESTQNWGSLGGSFAEMLKASTKAKISWKKVFAGFRASVLSSKRKLTRMRPNRRTGFENMGSIRRFNTKLLVAVDVSGSIGSQALSYFYGVINSAFKYGFEAIDVIQFDCGITQVQSLKKTMKNVTALGRGGTSFQEPIDYAHKNEYDGLLILTDGYAPEPTLPDNMRCKMVWVCQDRNCYEQHHRWMEKLGRVCTMEIH